MADQPVAATTAAASCSSLSGFSQFECEVALIIPIPFWADCVIVCLVLLIIIIIIIVCCCKKKSSNGTAQVNVKPHHPDTSPEVVQPIDDDEVVKFNRHLGNLQVTVKYEKIRHMLHVTIHGANELPNKSGMALNTYCRCYLEHDRKRSCESKVVPASICPRYDKDWSCKLTNREFDKALIIAVHETGRNVKPRVIGRIRLQFLENNKEILEKGLIAAWKPLQPVDPNEVDDTSAGEICLSLRYLPEESRFFVVLYECKSLHIGDGKQILNPFIELRLRFEKKPLTPEEEEEGKKRKLADLKKVVTDVKRHTNDPYFNLSFEFDVPLDIMKRAELLLTVWSDSGMSPIKVGKLNFSRRSSGGTAAHWVDMLRGSKKPLAQWHTIEPPHLK